METLSGRRVVNLVVYTLALMWVVFARLAWSYGDLTTIRMFKICAPAVGLVIGSIAFNYVLDRTESQRPPRGFEVDRDEKKKRL